MPTCPGASDERSWRVSGCAEPRAPAEHYWQRSCCVAPPAFKSALFCAYVAAVAMTSSQQSLSVIAGSNFAAVDMISLRQSLSVAGRKTNLFCVSRCLQQPIATADLTMLQQSLSAIAGSNFAAVVRFLCGIRGPSRTAATWMQPLRAATTSRQSVGILCSNLC